MTTKPNAKAYGIPSTCITSIGNGTENDTSKEGLAKHPGPTCLSLSERIMLYNQEVLFLQGKEILQSLAKLNANSAAAAAVGIGHAPAASAEPVAAGAPNVKRSDAELFESLADSARELASVYTMKAKAAEEEEAREESLEDGEEPTKEAAKVIPPKEKNIVSEAGSSQTVGREQAMTEVHEIPQSMPGLATVIERHDVTRSNSRVRPNYEQAVLLKVRAIRVARESALKNIVPKARTAIVGRTMEKGGANARIEEKNLQKRVRSPVLTSTSDVEDGRPRRASEKADDAHRKKKVKFEVKSEPGEW